MPSRTAGRVQHEKQQPIQVDKTKLFQEKQCLRLGFCVCTKKEEQKMNKALIQAMKMFFTKVNKVASPQRRLLEDWRVVVQLRSIGEDQEEVELFLHLGASNLRTWEFVCLRLEEYERDQTCVTLRVSGCGCAAAGQIEVKSLLHFLVTYLDPMRPCTAHFMKVCSDAKTVAVDRMMPMYVDVESLQQPIQFWQGQEPQEPLRRGRRGPKRRRAVVAAAMADDDSDDDAVEDPGDVPPGEDDEDEADEADEDMMPDEQAAQLDNDESDAEDMAEQFANLDDLDMDELYAFAEAAQAEQKEAEDDDGDDGLWRTLDDLMAAEAAAGAAGPHVPAGDGRVDQPEREGAGDDGARPGRRPRRAAAAARGMAAGGRAAPQAEMVYDMQEFGLTAELRYNARGFLRAHCKCPHHGQSCRRQRQTTPGRLGAGRPVGSLIAWLRAADEAGSQADHVALGTESHVVRSEARAWFETLPGANLILNLERPRGPDEAAEPRYLP